MGSELMTCTTPVPLPKWAEKIRPCADWHSGRPTVASIAKESWEMRALLVQLRWLEAQCVGRHGPIRPNRASLGGVEAL